MVPRIFLFRPAWLLEWCPMSCTTILVGKNASYDGSTIIARDDDSGSGRYDPKRFVAVAPDDQPRHYRSVLSHVEIELPDNPCRYTIAPNVLNNRGILAEAGANEHNVAMSATETIAATSACSVRTRWSSCGRLSANRTAPIIRPSSPAVSVRKTSSPLCCRMSPPRARASRGWANCSKPTAPTNRTA